MTHALSARASSDGKQFNVVCVLVGSYPLNSWAAWEVERARCTGPRPFHDVQVDHGGRNVAVAKQALDGANIGDTPAGQQPLIGFPAIHLQISPFRAENSNESSFAPPRKLLDCRRSALRAPVARRQSAAATSRTASHREADYQDIPPLTGSAPFDERRVPVLHWNRRPTCAGAKT